MHRVGKDRPLGIPPGDTIVGADLPGYVTGAHYKALSKPTHPPRKVKT